MEISALSIPDSLSEKIKYQRLLLDFIQQLNTAIEEQVRLGFGQSLSGPTLFFCDDGHTIRWPNGEIRVGHKPWLFLRALWRGGEKHRAKLERIERKVWGEGRFVPSNTIAQMAKRLAETLKKASFPYKILPLQKKFTLEIQGYQLRYDKL